MSLTCKVVVRGVTCGRAIPCQAHYETMYRIERQHEGPTRGHWLPVKGATYGTREEATTALRETIDHGGRAEAGSGRGAQQDGAVQDCAGGGGGVHGDAVKARDEMGAPGYLTLRCSTPGCGWAEWRDPLSPDVEAAKRGTFKCDFCTGRLIRHADDTVSEVLP